MAQRNCILVIIFKCRHQTAPQYLQELCVPVTASTSPRHLRSAARGDLQVLACRSTSFGPRSFALCIKSNQIKFICDKADEQFL